MSLLLSMSSRSFVVIIYLCVFSYLSCQALAFDLPPPPPLYYYLEQKLRPLAEEKLRDGSVIFGGSGRPSGEVPVYAVMPVAGYSGTPMSYKVPITIGDKAFDLTLDTGSSATWVVGSKAPPSVARGRPTLDTSRQASTFVPDGKSFKISYIGCMESAQGYTGTATLGLKGMNIRQTIGVATKSNVNMGPYPAVEGILGLGPRKTKQRGCTNFPQPMSLMENILSKMGPQNRLFTVSLRDNHYSHMRFGVIDNTKYSGQLIYSPLDQNEISMAFFGTQWGISAAGISIGDSTNKPVFLDTSEVMTWIDTGAPLLHLPAAVVKAYLSRVPGNSMTTPGLSLIAPCDTPLPDLHLHLQAGNGRNTIRKVATVAGENLRGDRLTPTGSDCLLRLATMDSDRTQILGLPFFNANFVVFDWGNKRIGFAPHAS